jgi:hypothetical protein
MSLRSAYAVTHGSTTLSGLTSLDVQNNAQVENETGIGSPYPQFAVVTGAQPRIPFATRAVATVLAVTGSDGAPITTANKLAAYFAMIGDNGLVAPGEVHTQYIAERGLLIPRRLSVEHQRSATLDLEALLYSPDGAAHPLAISHTLALPTIARDNIRHTIKSVVIGNGDVEINLGCVTRVEVNFGSQARTVGCSSDVYDSHLVQDSVQPTISITGITPGIVSNDLLEGILADHAETVITLRQYDESGVGFAAEEDVVITAHGLAVLESHSGQGSRESSVTLNVTCAWDGTNKPIVITT